jgi:hypothetical protein
MPNIENLKKQASFICSGIVTSIKPWGARTFIVRDPEGNQVLFAERGD